jgi:hypothetical protein
VVINSGKLLWFKSLCSWGLVDDAGSGTQAGGSVAHGRKIGHLTRRRHGGRRARVRGQTKIAADFALLAAAVNLARLAVLGLHTHPARRAVKPTG